MTGSREDRFHYILNSLRNPKKIKAPREIKEAYQLKCPCHDDKEASLTVSL